METIMPRSGFLNEDSFRHYARGVPGPTMSLGGTVGKTLFLMGAMLVGATLGVYLPYAALKVRMLMPLVMPGADRIAQVTVPPFFWPGAFAMILAVIGFIAWTSRRAQVYLAFPFALVQGMCIASGVMATNPRYQGVVLMIAVATCALVVVLLIMNYFSLVSDLSAFQVGVGAAFITMAAGLLVILLLRALGLEAAVPRQTTIISLGIGCGIMFFLAQRLLLGFGYIEEGIEMGAPKWMEWQAALGLMVSLIDIYIMLILLLGKTARNRNSRD